MTPQRAAYNLLCQAQSEGRVTTHFCVGPVQNEEKKRLGEKAKYKKRRRVNKDFASGIMPRD